MSVVFRYYFRTSILCEGQEEDDARTSLKKYFTQYYLAIIHEKNGFKDESSSLGRTNVSLNPYHRFFLCILKLIQ